MPSEGTQADLIRRLWERIDREGLLRVAQIVRGPDWTILVNVPWCRFAREVRSDSDYDVLAAKLRQSSDSPAPEPAPTPAIEPRPILPEPQVLPSGEVQPSLF